MTASRSRTAADPQPGVSEFNPTKADLSSQSLILPNEVDRRIWNEELSHFVPERLFDVHCHMYREEFDLKRKTESAGLKPFQNSDLQILRNAESSVMPGRKVHHLAFPFPFEQCDFDKSNEFVADAVQEDPRSGALMLVHPTMTEKKVERTLCQNRLLGLKPYLRYCTRPKASTSVLIGRA